MNISELFEWSAEARMISYMITCKMEDNEKYHFADSISANAKIHKRTVLSKMKKLINLDIIESVKMKDSRNRTRNGYRLKYSTNSLFLVKLEKELLSYLSGE